MNRGRRKKIPNNVHPRTGQTPGTGEPSQKSSSTAKGASTMTAVDKEEFTIWCIVKKTREILNKITADNFDKLVLKFMELPLEDKDERILSVICVVFEKAINDPLYSGLYAKLVHTMCKTSQETSKKFRKQILDQCQKEFQKSSADEDFIKEVEQKLAEATDEETSKELEKDLEERKYISRERSLGNVRFIGELYKLQMFTPKIMVECVDLLLYVPDEEKLQCLCIFLRTAGKRLDLQLKHLESSVNRGEKTSKFIPEKNWMEKIFNQLKDLSEDKKFTSRTRFKVMDVVELRDNGWKPRGDKNAPNTLEEFRKDSRPLSVSPKELPEKEEGTVNTSESVRNMFQVYLVFRDLEDTHWLKKHFLRGSSNVEEFIDEMSRHVAEMRKHEEQNSAGRLIRLLIRNKEIMKDTVIRIMGQGVVKDLPDILIDSPNATTYLAHFFVEIFSEERDLDWLVQLGKGLLSGDDDDGVSPPWRDLSANCVNLLKLRNTW